VGIMAISLSSASGSREPTLTWSLLKVCYLNVRGWCLSETALP
jgi:hypothetical protein